MTRPLFGSPTGVPSPDFDALPAMYGLLNQPTAELLFTQQVYRQAGKNYALANYPGWSFSRASTKTAQDSAGRVFSFASGVPAITDLGLLVEAASTNLALQSQALGTTPWSASSAGVGIVPTVTNNFAAAPDGTLTATRLQLSINGGTTTADQSLVIQALTTSGASRASFYIKTTDGTSKTVFMRGLATVNMAVTGTWQRYDFDAGTLTGTQFGIGLRGGQTPTNSNTADILVWGAQLEAGASASSYIPTTSASVTRAADALTLTYSGSPTSATVTYGSGSTATPSATSPLNLGSSSGGAWVGNYVQRVVVK